MSSRRITWLFGLATSILVWISLASYWSTHELVHSFSAVAQAHQALEKFQHIEVLMEAAESNVRGYAITGDSQHLEAYQYAKLVVPYELRQIESLLRIRPEKIKAFDSLETLLKDRLDYLTKVVTLRRSQGYVAAAQAIASETRSFKNDPMERLLSEVQQEELAQLRGRWSQASSNALTTKIILVAATLATLALLGWVFALLRRQTRERRQAETTTQQTEAFLHSIIERIPYMILVKEAANLRFTLVNKAAEEWLGRPREELLNSNELDFRSKSEALASIQDDRRVLTEGEMDDFPEQALVVPGKENKIVHTQKIPVPDADGNPAYLLTLSEDITRRKQAERMLELSRDAAVEAVRLRSEFIRNMSHEFRTPLAIVTGMTSLLLDTELTRDQKRFAETVRRAAEGLGQLIKGILDFSKIESGAFTLETREMNVRPLVEEVAAMLKDQAKIKGVNLVSLIDQTLPSVLRGDPVRLRQALTHLITNAVKFTERGEVIVRVTESRQTDSQIWLHFRITDTGVGISDEAKKHLFEAFRQGDGSPTRRYGGTGLGLAMSKRIVELMGGEIGFESAVGQGSAFWFTIPLNKRHVHGPTVDVPSLPWAQARVLIASENNTHRQLLQQELNAWALTSEAVSSGQAALDLLHREQKAGRAIPIMLLDMHLPDMDGITLARSVKKNDALKNTKLVALTAGQAVMDAATASSLGFSGWVPVPFKPEELYDRLASLIDPTPPTRQQHAA